MVAMPIIDVILIYLSVVILSGRNDGNAGSQSDAAMN